MKNLVFDMNVILDLWLSRQPEAQLKTIASLLLMCRQGSTRGWVASSSLHVLEYLAVRQFKSEGVDPAQARQTVRQLLNKLLDDLSPLSTRRDRLQLGGDRHSYLDFRYLSCELHRLAATDHIDSDNLVVRLNLPNMVYPPADRLTIYAAAQAGLATLET